MPILFVIRWEGLVYEGTDYASSMDVEADTERKEEEKLIDERLCENLTVV